MSNSAVDVDWCLSCDKRIDSPGRTLCVRCQPSNSRQIFSLDQWASSEDSDDDEYQPTYPHVTDTSPIAAWRAKVPTGAPPRQLSFTTSSSSSQPALLRPRSSRPVPPALSMSESTSTSIPISTPPAPKHPSILSSFAHHVRTFVSSPAAGFPVNKPKTKKRVQNLSSTIHHLAASSVFSEDDEHDDDGPIISPTNSLYADAEDLWWVTESPDSPDSPSVIQKSSAQIIASPTRRDEDYGDFLFQPKVLPIPFDFSSRLSEIESSEDEDEDSKIMSSWRSRGRRVR
ncbi:hypothetical protein D9757_004845 [Collybiopsis confluens]|uniref:Uncharacterized protein n=1 Tax=Collybiopsis confluens TaxID=2823264 RepID=A0A8H5HT28_9AGAR|nr:hypothetical protein D9757_004845 [Collybiopsis confluens]